MSYISYLSASLFGTYTKTSCTASCFSYIQKWWKTAPIFLKSGTRFKENSVLHARNFKLRSKKNFLILQKLQNLLITPKPVIKSSETPVEIFYFQNVQLRISVQFNQIVYSFTSCTGTEEVVFSDPILVPIQYSAYREDFWNFVCAAVSKIERDVSKFLALDNFTIAKKCNGFFGKF